MILAPIMFLQVPLRSSSADLPSCGNLTIIEATTHPHALPENSARDLMRSTRRHAPPRAVTCQGPLADVSPSDVIIATSFADVTAMSSADVIVDQDVDQTVDQR